MDSVVGLEQLRRQLLGMGRTAAAAEGHRRTMSTGFAVVDALLSGAGLSAGAVHEIIPTEGSLPPVFFGLILARAAASASPGRRVVLSDSRGSLYPPALAAMGLAPERLMMLRIPKPADELWAVAECLRCKGVAATVASVARLAPVEARRLQLAAEYGGGIGVLLRTKGALSSHYAAATRWVVRPLRGEERVQRWEVVLVHGHGGLTDRSVLLEVCRGTNHVRAVDMLADRPGVTAVSARASA